MKTKSGKIFVGTMLAAGLMISACVKKPDTPPVTNPVTYTSLADFYTANAVKTETFTIDATAGGSFVSAKGTKVTIQGNAFIDGSAIPVTGSVKIEFRDIYKKSDMLLSQMPVMFGNGMPLKSGGEFFIKASQGTTALDLKKTKPVIVEQPADAQGVDTSMKPFVFVKGAGGNGWAPSFGDTISPADSVNYAAAKYIFTLYKFSQPAGDGTWCNSDDASYFNGYTKTILNIVPDYSVTDYATDVYLVFKNVNSMVHIYGSANTFPYIYAPVGLSCTVVAIGVKDKKLYSSFTDITITPNQTVHFSLSETTEDAYKTKLGTLN